MPYLDIWELRESGLSEQKVPDGWAQSLIEQASSLIDEWTGWHFDARYKSIKLDGNGRTELDLPLPIVSLASVKVDGNPVPVHEIVVYSDGEDRFDPRIYLRWGWPKGRRNVEIAGEWGFVEEDGSPPAAIRQACKLLVFWLLKSPDERRMVSQESAEGAQVIYQQDRRFSGFSGNPEIDNLLIRYRRPLVVGLA